MNLPDFLCRTDTGTYRFTGHRIDLYHVVTLHANGHTTAMIHAELPSLSPEIINRAVEFYESNKTEVDAYVREWDAEFERALKSPRPGPTEDELRRRFEALRPAESA